MQPLPLWHTKETVDAVPPGPKICPAVCRLMGRPIEPGGDQPHKLNSSKKYTLHKALGKTSVLSLGCRGVRLQDRVGD